MKGLLFAIVGTWLGGLAVPGIKYMLGDMSPFNLIVASNFGAIVIIFFAKARWAPGFHRIPKGERLPLAGGLALGSIAAVPLAIIGMTRVSGSVAGLLFNLETFFTFFLAWLVFKEPLSKTSWCAMLLVFAGGLVSALGGPVGGDWTGAVMIILACLCFAIQSNVLKKVLSVESFSLALYEFSSTFLVAAIFVGLAETPFPSSDVLWKAFFIGVVTYAFGNVFFFQSLRRIGAARTSTIYGAGPLLGALSSFVLLGDTLTPAVAAGVALVAAGVGALIWEEFSKNKTPTEE